MPNKAPTFFSIARQPKWIGALLLSLAVAAVFALLGQWQLERSFSKDAENSVSYVKLETYNVMLDTKNLYIVEERLQKGVEGFWVIANSTDEAGKSLTLALGWNQNLAKAESFRTSLQSSMIAQAFLPVQGVLMPPEAPKPQNEIKPYLLSTVSLAQLVNLYSPEKPIATYNQYLSICDCEGASAYPYSGQLEPIHVDFSKTVGQINWLSAFYFLEWMLFAGFAVFLWWRLVKDQLILQLDETVN